MKSRPFVVLRPGGNDTALFTGIPNSLKEKKEVNDAILQVYPNVEQVGFVNEDPSNAKLVMAGGEFCGNATRSAAYKILRGISGNINIEVSGVKRPLRAGVTKSGDAFAQMPVYSDVKKITQDPKNVHNVTVQMEGITHYLDFSNRIEGFTEKEIKEKARAEMARKGLDKCTAAGIIYTRKEGNSWKIDPVVYVRDIDTTYYETACGSGTVALALVLALKQQKSVNDVPIVQPSGLAINASVDYDGTRFGEARIQGQIESLTEGSLENLRGRTYAVEQVFTPKHLQEALRSRGLRDAYKDAFGRPPYNESYSDREIDELFRDYQRDGHVFIAIDKGQVIAFSATQPLTSVPDIGELLAECPGINHRSWYIPDLGIRKEYEGSGIAKNLMQKALSAVPVDIITLRTNVMNTRSQALYKKLGFYIVPGLYQEIEQTRVNGTTDVDRRLFMALDRKSISSK